MRNRVREERIQRGISQAEIAAALGVSRQTVISIENGRYSPSLPLAFRIARFFDSTGDKMFDPGDEVDHQKQRQARSPDSARDNAVWPFVLVIGVQVIAVIGGLAVYGA